MKITVKRTVEPASFGYQIVFEEEDLARAFYDVPNPDEDLYYLLYSPAFLELSAMEQVLTLTRLIALTETEQAASLNLVAEPPQPKG